MPSVCRYHGSAAAGGVRRPPGGADAAAVRAGAAWRSNGAGVTAASNHGAHAAGGAWIPRIALSFENNANIMCFFVVHMLANTA